MNILPGECDASGRVTCAGFLLEGTVTNPCPGPVSIGLRPEHLTLTESSSSKGLSGKLTYKENLGSDVFLHVLQAGMETPIIIRTQPLEATPQKMGDTVHCLPVSGKSLVFDADGKRVELNAPTMVERSE